KEFSGEERLEFTLEGKPSEDLMMDFAGGRVESIAINGQKQPASLALSHSALLGGANVVEIRFAHPYENSGPGLNRVRDPKDGRIYLFTQTEPRGARRIFPCFDQPRLKASYTLEVEAPKDWSVIANGAEKKITSQGSTRRWSFAASPVFSTYLFALHAGPYFSWSDHSGGVSLRLFATRSFHASVDSARWFAATREGLKFYGNWFSVPYPFGKYDQVIVPRETAWASESVAAATFTEGAQAQTRGAILHELAHVWTGDLATMEDWDDYWLKEGLTVVISNELAGEWPEFSKAKVARTLELDSEPGAKPLRRLFDPHRDADEQVFNLPAYGKGAAVLRQLQFLVGPEVFQRAVRVLVKKFAYRGFTADDFLAVLSEQAHRSLAAWSASWLETGGVNTLLPTISCGPDGKVSALRLTQLGKPLREHKTRVALLYREPRDALFFDVVYSDAETPVAEAVGKPCPVSVSPNAEERDYVIVH
ncbi:MAG: M1 family aminopeptidase, partial [Bdellovibrionota bacterium]